MLEVLRVLGMILWFNSFFIFLIIGLSVVMIKEKVEEKRNARK